MTDFGCLVFSVLGLALFGVFGMAGYVALGGARKDRVALERMAQEGGWRVIADPDYVSCYQFVRDGVTCTLGQARPQHRPSGGRTGARPPVVFSTDLPDGRGPLLLVPRLPALLRGKDGALFGHLFGGLVGMLRPDMKPVIEALRELPGQDGESLVAYGDPSDAVLARALRDVLRPVSSARFAKTDLFVAEGKLVIQVWTEQPFAHLVPDLITAGLAARALVTAAA